MEIIIGKTAGFCFGVQRAVDNAEEIISKEKDIYCLGEIVHNQAVIENLSKKGLKFINKVEDGKNKIIIRAHGAGKTVYDKAKEIGIELIDLTCPKVLKIHQIAEEYATREYYIFLIGKKEHPEIIGTKDYCGKSFYIIENVHDVKSAIEKLQESKIKKLLILSQTTYSIEQFDKIIESIKKEIGKEVILEIKNTICSATRLRQEETIKLAQEVDFMIIIGGRNSSNTNKLYETAKKYTEAILIENKVELLNKELTKYKKIGIMAGASTAKKSINETIEFLKDM